MADESTQYELRLDAIRRVLDAAGIHADNLERDINDKFDSKGFQSTRRAYVDDLRTAIRKVRAIRYDGETKLMQRVTDLTLEEAVDLQLAVEEQIRVLRKRSFERTVY